tara:strand:+ start:2045 stop:2839 length:795 start_codon:yes stop_codon:yes gene_type:complete
MTMAPPVTEMDTNEYEADDLAYLQEMIATAERADEPGDTHTHDTIVGNADEGLGVSAISELSSAGYVWMYDTQTGDPSRTNLNMLPEQLQKTREDGSRRFTTNDPGFRPVVGTIKCMLHADDPSRETYSAMGLPVCPKATILSKMSLLDHMRHKHPQENKMISQLTTDAKEARQTEREEATLVAMQKMAGFTPAPPPVAEPVAPIAAEVEYEYEYEDEAPVESVDEPKPVQIVAPCPICVYKAKSMSQGGATRKLNTHKRKKHG